MLHRFWLLLFLVLFLSPLAEVRGGTDIFVTIPPQQWLVDQIGGPHTSTRVLIDKGQDPHTFEPTPKQIAQLSNASLFFSVGMEFETTILGKLAATHSQLTIIDSGKGVQRHSMESDDHHHHHHGERESDPHIWLSPVNLQIMAKNVAKALIASDPQHQAFYSANLSTTLTTLRDLHTTIGATLAPFKGRKVYVFHPAFGYFTAAYGLEQQAVETGGKSPSPRQIRTLIQQAITDKVKVLFVQPQFDPKSAQAIARAIGGKVVALDHMQYDPVANLTSMATQIESALSQQP